MWGGPAFSSGVFALAAPRMPVIGSISIGGGAWGFVEHPSRRNIGPRALGPQRPSEGAGSTAPPPGLGRRGSQSLPFKRGAGPQRPSF